MCSRTLVSHCSLPAPLTLPPLLPKCGHGCGYFARENVAVDHYHQDQPYRLEMLIDRVNAFKHKPV